LFTKSVKALNGDSKLITVNKDRSVNLGVSVTARYDGHEVDNITHGP